MIPPPHLVSVRLFYRIYSRYDRECGKLPSISSSTAIFQNCGAFKRRFNQGSTSSREPGSAERNAMISDYHSAVGADHPN